MKKFYSLCALAAALLIPGSLAVPSAAGADATNGCCLELPAVPNNEADGLIKMTWGPSPLFPGVAPEFSRFTVDIQPGGVNVPTPPIPPGRYAAWCSDVETGITIGNNGTMFGGYLFSTCDPTASFNDYLPDHPNVKRDAATWKQVNYLINHRFQACNGLVPRMWEVQRAIWVLLGQPLNTVPSPPYPPYRTNVVDCLVNTAIANAPTWNLSCGDKVAVIFNIDINWDEVAPEVQLIFLEVPYCPPIACPQDVEVSCHESLDPAVNPNLGVPTTDPCCDLQIGYVDSITSSNCPGNYTITRTWTASTECATKTCVQTITVTDSSIPEVVVPNGEDLGCNPAVVPTEDTIRLLIAARDICGEVTTNVTVVDVPSGCSIIRTFTVTAVDQCGNTSEPKVIVYSWKVDTNAPTLVGLPSESAVYQCLSEVPQPPTVTAVDNCDGPLPVMFSSVETGTPCDRVIVRTWAVGDSCGNSNIFVQTITVKDTIAPVLVVPTNFVAECSSIPGVGAASATDNCDANPVVEFEGETSLVENCTNIVVRTWTATDSCGNVATLSQTIYLIDTTAPILAGVPTNVTVQCSEVPEVPEVTATDGCDTNTIIPLFSESRTDGSCSNTYVLVRTWIATDICGNSVTNTQTVTVTDTVPPTLVCANNKQVECGQPWSFDEPAANDACGDVTISIVNTTTNGTGCNVTYTRTWQAKDACGNTATCTQTVTTGDTTPPQITCPPDVTLTNSAEYCSYTPGGWGAPPNGNNPGKLLCDHFDEVFPSGCVEIGIPGWAGKSIKFTSAAAITAFLPSGGTPGALTSDLVNPTGQTSAGVFAQHVLALTLNVHFSAAGITGTPGSALGDLTVNYPGSPLHGKSIKDILAIANIALGGGNVSAYGVTLNDLSAIVDLFNNAFDNCVATSWATAYLLPNGGNTDPGTATATDNCDETPTITFTDEVVPGPCGAVTNRTWKATDDCGNSATCVQVISTTKDEICVTRTFNFNGNSYLDGQDGNTRTYTTNGLSVKVTAFSRVKSTGVWAPAYVGAYSGGLGVTDSSEGDGSGNSHTVDNIGRDNFLLFEFSAPVVIKKATLGYVVTDSDFMAWIGNFANPYTNHLNLTDAVLGSFSYAETNYAPNASPRTALINAGEVVGNAFVIAALPGVNTCDDQFKVQLLEVCQRSCEPPPPPTTNCLGSICGTILRDCNADGSLSGEEGLEGIVVKVRNSGGTVVGTDTTDANGAYCIGNLAAGTYTVEVVPGNDYCQTYDPDGSKNNKTTVTLKACENKTGVKFGYTGTDASVYLVKTGPAKAAVGETITYKFAVTNTGNTCLYGGMSINDPMLGGVIWHQTPVVPGEGFVVTKTYTVKSTDPKTLCNTATAIGHPPFGLPKVTYQSSWTVTITNNVNLPKPPCPTVQPGNCYTKLTCTPITGTTSFNVKRSLTPGGPYTVVKSGHTSSSYTDYSCENGKTYYYVVSCIVGGVESPNSDEACSVPTAGLPSPWQSKNIGSVGATGGASYASANRKFTVVGSGEDIWNSGDEFRFVYQQANYNCTIVARVASVDETDSWAKAGIMIRESLTPGSKHASVFVTPDNGVAAQYRETTGGASGNVNTTGLSAPYWVKLVRSGNTFTAYRSSNGSNWTLIGSKTISMSSSVYIGLAVTAHNDGAQCTATFDNVTVSP